MRRLAISRAEFRVAVEPFDVLWVEVGAERVAARLEFFEDLLRVDAEREDDPLALGAET